ncbi:hypothetical protein ES703_66001 [subsurface metagenome]
MSTNITKVYEVLKECYKFVDFRCAYFKEDDKWISIVSTFRFTNKEYDVIKDFHDRLRKLSHNTDWFKVECKILKPEDWKTKWELIKNNADFLKKDFDLDSLELYRNLEHNSHSPTTQVDKEYNTIQFNVSSYEYKEHQKRLEYLKEKKELRSIGITSIYPIIRQILQIQFDRNSQIFSVFLFPIYFKIKNVSYHDNKLSGDIEYHKVFYKSNLIIKHYLRGKEEGIIETFLIEDEIKPNQEYGKTQFEILIEENLHQIEENISEFVINLYFSPFNTELTDFRHYASRVEIAQDDEILGKIEIFELIYEFDLALSFAGENREIVEQVAKILDNRRIKVFYDEFYKAKLLGTDLAVKFKEIYGEKSKYVVVFVSEHYEKKLWSNYEFEIARKAIQSRGIDYILPIRLDDTILYGLKETIAYIDMNKEGVEKTVDILCEKLTLHSIATQKSKPIQNKINELKSELNPSKMILNLKSLINKTFLRPKEVTELIDITENILEEINNPIVITFTKSFYDDELFPDREPYDFWQWCDQNLEKLIDKINENMSCLFSVCDDDRNGEGYGVRIAFWGLNWKDFKYKFLPTIYDWDIPEILRFMDIWDESAKSLFLKLDN